ncbi:kelch repeat-containing protein, partial [Streptomyces sp. NPDC048411]|uniref:Kelch repeat-containing protein n=1 Tax=Streptomyces sp. NPDC048411 TaxID=3157206 RepID=UPI00345653F5
MAADSANKANFSLKAGKLAFTPGSIDKTVDWGKKATQDLTVKNTGGAPASLTLGEQPGGFTQLVKGGAPLNLVKGNYSPLALSKGKTADAAPAADAAGDAWQPVANLPTAVQDNAVAVYDGKVYSAFGYTGSADTNALYAYDPDSGSWTKLASAADTREGNPAHGFIGGKLYVVGGWGASGAPDAKLEVYDPASNSWSTKASSPKPYAGSGSVVLGGKLYVVGGCTSSCGTTDATVYDPSSDSWSQIASYPEPISWQSCGGIDGKLYCAGGSSGTSSTKHAYVYDPGADSWSPIADMPADLWGSAYGV